MNRKFQRAVVLTTLLAFIALTLVATIISK